MYIVLVLFARVCTLVHISVHITKKNHLQAVSRTVSVYGACKVPFPLPAVALGEAIKTTDVLAACAMSSTRIAAIKLGGFQI